MSQTDCSRAICHQNQLIGSQLINYRFQKSKYDVVLCISSPMSLNVATFVQSHSLTPAETVSLLSYNDYFTGFSTISDGMSTPLSAVYSLTNFKKQDYVPSTLRVPLFHKNSHTAHFPSHFLCIWGTLLPPLSEFEGHWVCISLHNLLLDKLLWCRGAEFL